MTSLEGRPITRANAPDLRKQVTADARDEPLVATL
ncbi:MAG: hypothetical protein QG671_3793, partial [Actinomycetota bacterium]|nr:hypothetical protein [Actinomycetota bacterium]